MSMSLLKEVVLLSIEVACYIIIAWYQSEPHLHIAGRLPCENGPLVLTVVAVQSTQKIALCTYSGVGTEMLACGWRCNFAAVVQVCFTFYYFLGYPPPPMKRCLFIVFKDNFGSTPGLVWRQWQIFPQGSLL